MKVFHGALVVLVIADGMVWTMEQVFHREYDSGRMFWALLALMVVTAILGVKQGEK